MWTLTENKEWAHLEEKFEWVRIMKDVPQDSIHHAEGDVAIHTSMVLTALQQDQAFQELPEQDQELLWAAALLHDVEKASTTVIEPDGRITAHGHARKGAQTARRILYRSIDTPFAFREQIVGLVRYHGLPIWILEKPDPLKALIMASFEVNTKWLAILARADVRGRICTDKEDFLYRIDCFEAFCQEQGCWGTTRSFTSGNALMHYIQKEDAHPEYIPFEQPETAVVLLSGLPGAGKDTFVRKYYKDWPVISLDALREKRGADYRDKTGNGQAIQEAKEQAKIYLRRRQPFVWNATNITRQLRSQLIELFLTYKASVKIVYLEVPYKKLIGQNKNREAVVPEAALERLIDKLEVPATWEAHEVEFH